MQTLNYEIIKGTPTAIVCCSQMQWDIVSLICGKRWSSNQFDNNHGHCISLNNNNERVYPAHQTADFYTIRGFKLIQAYDFIKDNLGYGNKETVTQTDNGQINLDKIISDFEAVKEIIDKQDTNDMAWNSVEGWVTSIYKQVLAIKNKQDLHTLTKGIFTIGTQFKSKYFKSVAKVINADIKANTLEVSLTSINEDGTPVFLGSFTETGWDLQHTIWAFERGDYFI